MRLVVIKIVLEIPDDCIEQFEDRNIRVFAGIDLIAEKLRGDKWKIKTRRCSMCGKCCMDLKEDHPFPVIDGQCVYLVNPPGYGNKWICGLGVNRPHGCAIGTPNADYCTVKYEYVK